ncbi:preprotein translocase subunit SecG [Pararhodobacter sp.]|uniref:preprotein translocase subunit SecG n=1 Tax=Pararhodobacter sp. TaxID=2127056 RepID=UPI002AFE38A2|nr:preprotein translocase subunit SecG [Pararhodobacter sp.]
MQNVVLVIHLLLALSLIGVVLLQRSEGGGLGIGGSMGPQAGRPPLTGLAKLTWGFAIAFFCTSVALTVIGASNTSDSSVLDRLGVTDSSAPDSATPALPLPDVQLPPAGDSPLLPPRQD